MPHRCVVGGCSNIRSLEKGIGLHTIPFYGDERPEAKKRRKRWIDFVRLKRAQWEPTKSSVICSKHFKPDDFVRNYTLLKDQEAPSIPYLERDSFGITAFPTVHTGVNVAEDEQPLSNRGKRMAIKAAMAKYKESSKTSTVETDEPDPKVLKLTASVDLEDHSTEDIHVPQADISSAEEECSIECSSCSVYKQENWQLQNRLSTSKEEIRQLKNKLKTSRDNLKSRRKEQRNWRRKEKKLQLFEAQSLHITDSTEDVEADKPNIEVDEEDEDLDGLDEVEVEDQAESGSLYTSQTETETETETEDENGEKPKGLSVKDKNIRSEPKHIVFLSQLLLLFKFCHICKADNPTVETREIGTEAVVKTSCNNPECMKQSTWYSQPLIPGSHIPAGNFLLCLCILLTGGSATKVLQMFKHMGLGCLSLGTFFKYQRTKLFPTIHLYWQNYQNKMLSRLKDLSGGVTIAGDGRHDSMGHSAKFGAYTIFCCTIPMIIHFALVQRNQAGSSTAMEFMAFKQCMNYLIGYGLLITTFISDRHVSIASHMKKVLTGIIHYFDIWHLKKKIRKVLSKISKEKGCEVLGEWIKPCEKHLHWSATSTFSGTVVYDKLSAALTNNALVKGIKQASPLAQTSCLEGFHSVLNHFAPKMIAYSYIGMYCRHILAAVHFNFNLQREVKHRSKDGVERVRVSYPKFKNGEATVRDVRITPNFDYVEEIFQTFMKASKDNLKDAATKLQEETPAPMNTMLEKQPRAEALQKRAERSKMVTKDVPPTTPVTQIPEGRKKQRKERTAGRNCTACKKPMKGHHNVVDCPKNKNKRKTKK
ncbi:PREDICTED: uncharacterized protein LOC107331715 isoform X2 [Acropora digitifera]|uniref:uncharacterized protein LOC107331715 isoform X2 n=1 Tax=Acropora digitifera TaxID=70779 RepID=UPI00077ACC94|nr:PREDICTED: uncharacterized protein LOC107331715 isoform X2 [Acropora digitifera]